MITKPAKASFIAPTLACAVCAIFANVIIAALKTAMFAAARASDITRLCIPDATSDRFLPFEDICPMPTATAASDLLISHSDSPAIICIPSATDLKPVPAFFAEFPIESMTFATASRTVAKPPLIASITVVTASHIAENPSHIVPTN